MGTGESKPAKLTNRQQVFIAEYLRCWNATDAARVAGYSKKSARQSAVANMANPSIKAVIEREIQNKAMGASEVLARLSDMARANLTDVLTLDDEFDLTIARDSGKTHLIKSIRRREFTDKDGNTTRTTEIELYDAQSALVQLGKHHKLFTTVHEVTVYDSLAKKLGVSTSEAREYAAKVAKGEMTIDDILTGKARLPVENQE